MPDPAAVGERVPAGLAPAVAALCRLSARLSADDRELLTPALLILAESLAESSTVQNAAPASRKEAQLQRLAELEQQLQDHDAGSRAKAIQTRLGVSKSTLYRLRLEAQRQRLG